MHIFDRSPLAVQHHGPYFSINATNLGPGRVCVQGVGLSHRNVLRRLYRQYIRKDLTRGVVLDALPESSDKLPKWLEVGESLSLFYPLDSDILQEHEAFDCLYLFDSIGGEHWAQKRVFEEARENLTQPDQISGVADD